MGNSDLYGGWSHDGDPRAPWNQPDPPECGECGQDLEWEWRFCPMCGKRIDWAELNGEEWWT